MHIAEIGLCADTVRRQPFTSQGETPQEKANLGISSSLAGKEEPTNRAAMGKLLGKMLLEKRKIFFSYLLVVWIGQSNFFCYFWAVKLCPDDKIICT